MIDPKRAFFEYLELRERYSENPSKDILSRLLELEEYLKEQQDKGFLGNLSDKFVRGTKGFASALYSLSPAGIVTGRSSGAFAALVSGALDSILGVPSGIGHAIPGTPRDIANKIDQLSYEFKKATEQYAYATGLDEDTVGAAYVIGKMAGYSLPVLGTYKIASIGIRHLAPGIDTALFVPNLVLDMTAGAIFGGVMSKEEDVGGRLKDAMVESAFFGAGKLVISGFGMVYKAISFKRKILGERTKEIDALMNGEVLPQGANAEKVLSEVSTDQIFMQSTRAASIVKEEDVFSALVEGIARTHETGAIGGFIKIDPKYKAGVTSARKNFPKIKFQTIEHNGETFVWFGTKNLTKSGIDTFKETGYLPGQIIEKNGARYVFISKKGTKSLVVADATGKQRVIREENITKTPWYEDIAKPKSDLEALFATFQREYDEILEKATKSASDIIPEEQFFREFIASDGKIPTAKLSPQARRPMIVGGAVVYPEELGEAGKLLSAEVPKGGFVLPSPRILSFDEVVEIWAKNKKLDVNAPEFFTIRSYFAQRMREKFWASIPVEDRAVYESIVDSFVELSEKGKIPFEMYASIKGFRAKRGPDGLVMLEDINTGKTFSFGNERDAREALNGIFRAEKNIIGGDEIPTGLPRIPSTTMGLPERDLPVHPSVELKPYHFTGDLPMFSQFRNVRDLMVGLEDKIGVPVFSSVVDEIITGANKMRVWAEPYYRKLEKAWRGLSREEREAVGRFWMTVQEKGLTEHQITSMANAYGLKPRQVRAMVETHKIGDALFKESGIDPREYISWYLSHIRPTTTSKFTKADLNRFQKMLPPEAKWWAEYTRRNQLAEKELDPLIIWYKYIRGLGFKKFLEGPYQRGRDLVRDKTTPRVRDLPEEVQKRIMLENPNISPNDPLIPGPFRAILSDALILTRGAPIAEESVAKSMLLQLFSKLGVKMEPKVIDELVGIYIQNLYGALLGFRPRAVFRNTTQLLWTMYPRLGSKFMGAGFEKGLSFEGFKEALEAGVLHGVHPAVPGGDVLWDSLAKSLDINATSTIGHAIKGVIRLGIRSGRLAGDISRYGLVPYSSVDDVLRSSAYHWQKLHTDHYLRLYENGKISWERFVEDGLPLFSDTVVRKFRNIYDRFGRTEALKWIGIQASNEANFVYMQSISPSRFQTFFGRLFSTFGTWPIWSMELYLNKAMKGTFRQKAAFTARTMAIAGAMTVLGLETGTDIWTWMAPLSFVTYTGGPAVDALVDLKRVIDAPVESKADALSKLISQGFIKTQLPGQTFLNAELRKSVELWDQGNYDMAFFNMVLGKPLETFRPTVFDFEGIEEEEMSRLIQSLKQVGR